MSADSVHSDENEALGSEFCSGYMDSMGKWNNGFYCPGESTEEQFCCGSDTFKYCCPKREQVVTEDTSRLPLLLGVMFGVVAAVIIIIMMLCCFCSCCILYKKRQPPANGGPLYRMHCSSTASGVANMYSFSNPTNLAATPLEAAVASARLLVDLDPVVAPHSLVPTESRTSMPRGHTFSRESRPIAVDLNISELGEMSDRVPATRTGLSSSEPPPPYNSSRDEQRPDSTVQILSHGTSFSQPTFNSLGSTCPSASIGLRPSPCVVSQTSSPGMTQIESELPSISQTFTNTGTPLAACTTFNPSPTTEPTATEQVAGSTSVVDQGTVSGVGPVLLPASSMPPLTTSVARGHDALYHSTKF